jgi:hypothetical protein
MKIIRKIFVFLLKVEYQHDCTIKWSASYFRTGFWATKPFVVRSVDKSLIFWAVFRFANGKALAFEESLVRRLAVAVALNYSMMIEREMKKKNTSI